MSDVSAGRKAPAVMLERLSGPLDALVACGVARRSEDRIIELYATREEVFQGGMVTVSMRVPVGCSACGPNTRRSCPRCGGRRVIDELFSAWLAIRPETADGTILSPTVLLAGMLRPVRFRIRVAPAPRR